MRNTGMIHLITNWRSDPPAAVFDDRGWVFHAQQFKHFLKSNSRLLGMGKIIFDFNVGLEPTIRYVTMRDSAVPLLLGEG